MNTRSAFKYLVLPLLALCVTLATVGSVRAQDRHDQGSGGASATLQITFGSAPHWVPVRGTHVREIREGERPDYDIFRCGGRYYVHNNDGWFVSRRPRGQFMRIEERVVPVELSRVPREHWRNYPQGWQDRGDARDNGRGRGQDKRNHDDKGDHGDH